MNSSEWQEYEVPPWRILSPPVLLDGIKASICSVIMRRMVGGKWQYRQMTDAEEAEYQKHTAW